MKIQELRNMTEEELINYYENCKKEIFNLRIKSIHSPLENPKRIKNLKRDIARVLTLLNERKRSKK